MYWAIDRDASGAMWIGTDRGVVRMVNGAVNRVWTRKDGLAGDKVKALEIESARNGLGGSAGRMSRRFLRPGAYAPSAMSPAWWTIT